MKKILFFLLIFSSSFISCKSDSDSEKSQNTTQIKEYSASKAVESEEQTSPLITFVELGSVNCIPCKKMQPVMKAIEEKYGKQVKVVFYDVWKPDQRKYAQEYGIRLIPTQVFLDKNGAEIFRHEGFFPEHEIDTFLQSNGLKLQNES
jgi:thioredoxin 1